MLEKTRTSFQTENREAILSDPKCRLITAVEFCRLLVSRSNLERSNETSLSLAGLRDRETGQRYFVELEKLRVFYRECPLGHSDSVRSAIDHFILPN